MSQGGQQAAMLRGAIHKQDVKIHTWFPLIIKIHLYILVVRKDLDDLGSPPLAPAINAISPIFQVCTPLFHFGSKTGGIQT